MFMHENQLSLRKGNSANSPLSFLLVVFFLIFFYRDLVQFVKFFKSKSIKLLINIHSSPY